MKARVPGGGIAYPALGAGMLAVGIAAIIFWLGHQAADDVLRLAAEGRVIQGEDRGTSYEGKSVTRTVGYVVGGRRYIVTATHSTGSRPLFDEDPIAVPRLGPSNPLQVVYLPSQPSIARLRDDLKEARTPVYWASGFFAVIGLVFGGVGFAVRRPRRR